MVKDLNTRAFARLLGLSVGLAALLFTPAWTLDYWQAWVFLAVFSLSMLGLTLYLIKRNPVLLERRLNSRPSSEKSRKQKIISSLVSSSLIVAAVFPAIDHRCAWSRVPACVVAAGDLLVALGVLILGLAFKENPFASAIIEVGTGQKIICTGPYAFVRHPMYLGWLVSFLGIPLALGSWWALLTIIPLTLVVALRLLDEEVFLEQSMLEYRNKVRYRLAPFVW